MVNMVNIIKTDSGYFYKISDKGNKTRVSKKDYEEYKKSRKMKGGSGVGGGGGGGVGGVGGEQIKYKVRDSSGGGFNINNNNSIKQNPYVNVLRDYYNETHETLETSYNGKDELELLSVSISDLLINLQQPNASDDIKDLYIWASGYYRSMCRVFKILDESYNNRNIASHRKRLAIAVSNGIESFSNNNKTISLKKMELLDTLFYNIYRVNFAFYKILNPQEQSSL